MLNVQRANNGQIVSAVKTYNELSAIEKDALTIPATTKLSDYANFQVRYNKSGKLLGCKPHSLSTEYAAKIEETTNEPNLIDGLTLLYDSPNSKEYQKARKRSKLSNKDIANARRLVQGNE